MFLKQNRIKREKNTIGRMIKIYCRAKHGSKNNLCDDCKEMNSYAMKKLEKCPYKNEKPACNNCPVHCYNNNMRDKIRGVMQYSGPRMILHHPLLAVLHIIDKKLYGNPVLDNFTGKKNIP